MPSGNASLDVTLILKRASASRPSGEWNDDDYDVLAGGVVVGRIYADASASTPPELRWFWSILEVIPDIKTHGHARPRWRRSRRVGDGSS